MKTNILYFNTRDELLRLDISKIVYFEADGNYTVIVTANQLKATIGISLVQMEKELAKQLGIRANRFCRIGKRYIINLNYVCRIQTGLQRLVLSDTHSFTYQLSVSKDALKKLKDMIDISLDFYKQLDIDIYNVVRYLYNEKGHILCKNRSINNNHLYGAITFHDYVFHDSFILIYLNNNITDLLNINHEIMHAFEFKENPKSPSNNYFGFHEVSTNTIDILFIEYLVKQGFNKKELYNIYNNSICRTKYFCEEVLCRIMDKINVDFGDSFIDVFNYDKVKDVLNLEIKYKLLEIESMVLGNCISNKISDDKNNINILKNFIYSKIDPNFIPDFSKYNISNEYMINYCLDTKKMIKKI